MADINIVAISLNIAYKKQGQTIKMSIIRLKCLYNSTLVIFDLSDMHINFFVRKFNEQFKDVDIYDPVVLASNQWSRIQISEP